MKNKYFKHKKILITGATGSVGASLIKELIGNHEFKVIRAMSNDENGLYSLKSIIRKNLSTYGTLTRKEKLDYYMVTLEVLRGVSRLLMILTLLFMLQL